MTTLANIDRSSEGAVASAVTTFDDLLARFENETYRFLMQLTRSRAHADELFQEMLAQAFHAFARLDGTVNHRAWLFKHATETFLRHHRRIARDRPPDGIQEVAVRERHDESDLIRDIEAFLESLPAKQRVALVLRRYHHLSYEEIGANLNCSEVAAQAYAHGALRKLRDHFRDKLFSPIAA